MYDSKTYSDRINEIDQEIDLLTQEKGKLKRIIALINDAEVVHRIENGVTKRVFKIDTGDVPTGFAKQYIEERFSNK